jgi:hypothetical protein
VTGWSNQKGRKKCPKAAVLCSYNCSYNSTNTQHTRYDESESGLSGFEIHLKSP